MRSHRARVSDSALETLVFLACNKFLTGLKQTLMTVIIIIILEMFVLSSIRLIND